MKDLMQQWKCDFEGLYNPVHNGNFDINHSDMIQKAMPQPLVTEGNNLDQPITLAEIQQSVACAKLSKAPGTESDEIPVETIKSEVCVIALHTIIEQAFEQRIVPSE